MNYQWKEGAKRRGSAQVIGERLEQIRTAAGGMLTPRQVVADAAPEGSPLHPHFEWNDTKAALEYRLEQARSLIRQVVVVHEEMPKPVRMYVCVQADGETERGYAPLELALKNPATRHYVLRQAKRDLESWRTKYADYRELSDAFGAIDAALEAWPEVPAIGSDNAAAA